MIKPTLASAVSLPLVISASFLERARHANAAGKVPTASNPATLAWRRPVSLALAPLVDYIEIEQRAVGVAHVVIGPGVQDDLITCQPSLVVSGGEEHSDAPASGVVGRVFHDVHAGSLASARYNAAFILGGMS